MKSGVFVSKETDTPTSATEHCQRHWQFLMVFKKFFLSWPTKKFPTIALKVIVLVIENLLEKSIYLGGVRVFLESLLWS